MLETILSYYDITADAIVQPFGSGLINSTWKVCDRSKEYILQKINHEVFKNPQAIADNIETISSFLKQHHPDYFFVAPVKTKTGEGMVYQAGLGYFRLFPFVKDSRSHTIARCGLQAFEAARQFGLFTQTLRDLPVESLKVTLPDFHNLALRFQQFEQACRHGNPERICQSREAITRLRQYDSIVTTYKTITTSKDFRIRITHHDTKISNVLFDKDDKGLCVIDLDTVMPGYYISDVGDMMRTYLSPVSEEEKDFSLIEVREDYFEAILEGYLEKMADELSAAEIGHFVYAGMFIIYMQALRFLTDYLNNDQYYGSSYAGHNYYRALNQITLLERLMDKEKLLNKMVAEAAGKVGSHYRA